MHSIVSVSLPLPILRFCTKVAATWPLPELARKGYWIALSVETLNGVTVRLTGISRHSVALAGSESFSQALYDLVRRPGAHLEPERSEG